MKKKLQNWYDIYPAGTKEGDEEHAFFISLSRNPKYAWRSTSGIAQETNLTKERVEQIIDKYLKIGLIYQHPKNDDNWGYWERVPEDMLPKKYRSLVAQDQKARIKKAQ
jgi:hypothetical protein